MVHCKIIYTGYILTIHFGNLQVGDLLEEIASGFSIKKSRDSLFKRWGSPKHSISFKFLKEGKQRFFLEEGGVRRQEGLGRQ